ncbi:MAG TPA: bifunctional phosphoglucose/phosphomannose isomerase [Bacteroidia bacterium]
MKGHIDRFPLQLEEALAIAEKSVLTKKENIHQVLVTGLGGSGIGGSVVAELVQNECKVPVLVNKDYFLPAYINQHTLVVISSYSGNTEETLSCFQQALDKKAQIVCITSGGKVAEIAKANNLDLITVPGGNPPRTCLGYSVTQLLKVLHFNQFISMDFVSLLKNSIAIMNTLHAEINEQAKQIAKQLHTKIPVIYSLGSTESISVRFRQQINENSKMLCWHNVIPEMNHNELVGWTSKNEDLAVVVLRTDYDYEKNIKRLSICKEVFSKYTPHYLEIHAKGKSKVEQAFYLIHLTDYVSYYLAELSGVDAIEVNVIDYLKKELA